MSHRAPQGRRASGPRVLGLFAALAVAGLFVASASSADAATLSSGLWYFSTFHVQDAHDAGWTGKGVTVAVLDSQIDPSVPTLANANIVVEPSDCTSAAGVHYPSTTTTQAAWHATNTVSLLVGSGAGYPGQTGVKGIAPDAKVLFYMTSPTIAAGKTQTAVCTKAGSALDDANADAVNSAVKAGAQIISVSLLVSDSPALSLAVANAEHRGVIVVGGLSDTKDQDLTTGAAPGANNGVVGVQAINSKGVLQSSDGSANISPFVDVVGPGDGILAQGSNTAGGSFQTQTLEYGTSFATPIIAGFLADVKQKYPSATGNQLIQSLTTNTGVTDHPASFKNDGYGYGAASLTHMLAVDPSKYPDKNPLISASANAPDPPASAIANPPSLQNYVLLLNGRSPSSPGSGSGKSTSSAVPVGLILGIGVVVLVIVLALIALIIVLAVRRSRRGQQPGSARRKG